MDYMKKEGLNISRSKRAIYDSFLKLVKKKDYQNISVQDILDDCGYSRSIFYHNFDSKYNMLNVLVADEAKTYIDCFIKGFMTVKTLESKKERCVKSGKAAFEFVLREKEFYTALINDKIPDFDKNDFFKFANKQYLEVATYPIEEQNSEINMDLYVSATTSIMGSFIEFWVREHFEHSAEYMANQLFLFLSTLSSADYVSISE